MFGYGNVDKKTKKEAIRMIKKILHLTELPDPMKEGYYDVNLTNGTFRFGTSSRSTEERYPFLSLRLDTEYSYEDHYYWIGNLEEYEAVFHSTFNHFMQHELKNVYELLRNDGKKMQYTYPLNVFEPALITALNTIQEAIDANSKVLIPAIQERVLELLSGCVSSIQAIEQNRIEHEERMRQATNDSLINRLDQEITYVKNHPLLTNK